MRRLRGRAWGNALGGWRRQGRDHKGRWLPKAGGAFRTAHRAGRYGQARRAMRSGGRIGAREGAISTAQYAVSAMSSLRQKGFFINPEVGLSGAGVSVGYGRKIAKNWRGSVAIKVSVRRTNDPFQAGVDKAFDKAGETFGKGAGRDSQLYNLAKYGVATTPIDGTVITRSGTTLRMKSGGKAARAERSIPKQRAAQDKAKREQAQYRAQRRKEAAANREAKKNGHPQVNTKKGKNGYYRETTLSNGTKIVNKGQWDDFNKKHNRAEVHMEHRRIRNKAKKRSNKKGVASTITA